MAILPMGMAQVSSVVFMTPESEGHELIVLTPEGQEGLCYDDQVAKVKEKLVDKQLQKGEMFSYFQFGASDYVMVFEREANINYTAEVNMLSQISINLSDHYCNILLSYKNAIRSNLLCITS
ncbi:MAG: phosphatidylserine decarboxylase [Mariprofundaceae bacterium]|nr:phosphatidylserine decarboxylase [Mariprofundaceae bacterium]